MNEQLLQQIKKGDLLDVIRVRTAMYTGARTLTSVYHFLGGYVFCLLTHGIQEPDPLPDDFHGWVAYRLHFFERSIGIKNMILERVPDEEKALDKFFELVDEHKERTPHIVALGTSKGWTSETWEDGKRREKTAHLPEPFAMVTYTNDPGFFVKGTDGISPHSRWRDGFFATLGDPVIPMFSSDPDFKILDQVAYDRLVRETNEHRQRSMRPR